jgi:glycosyltransferase involved in cell wall biosynthesis/ubiquinone/menaquinone biosynthesis C-methylase UbiE
MKSPELNNPLCSVCGGVTRRAARPEGFVCVECGLFFRGLPASAAPASSSENNAKVYLHSKKNLFASALRKLNALAPSRGKLLDIGCGFGYFLKAAEADGWACEGLEISPEAIEHARGRLGLKIYGRPLSEMGLPSESYDAVTMWGVLDVLPDPAAALKEIERILSPGGILFVRVNNFAYHRGAFRFASKVIPRFLRVSPAVIHSYGFGRTSLASILSRNGFEPIKIANARPTSGDPYGTGGRLGGLFVSVFKTVYYAFARTLEAVTYSKILASSSIETFAVKKNPRAKILHIITRLDMGGSAVAVRDVCAGLNPQKFESVLIYGRTSHADINAAPSGSCAKIIYLPRLIREISPFDDAFAFAELVKIILRERPQIVHTHSSKAGVLGRLAAFTAKLISSGLRRLKTVHTPHGHIFYGYYGGPKTAFFAAFERLAALAADYFTALTEGEKNESLARGLGNAGQWTVIPSGVKKTEPVRSPADIRREFGVPDGAPLVGTVARLEKVKGVEYFVRAAAGIAGNMAADSVGIRFLVVGDGSLRGALEDLAAKLNIADKIIFAGARKDVSDLINAMDVYVQPSLNEGMGRTIVEAMYLSRPIVATNVQGIPDLIYDGRTGLLAPPSDPAAIAAAVKKLLADKSLAGRLGKAAYDYASEEVEGGPRFGARRMIYLYEKLYEKIIKNN